MLYITCNHEKKKLHPQSFFKSSCAHFYSSWWTQATLHRYLRPVSSYWLCSQQSCCTTFLSLFCSTRGETIISDTYFYICKPVIWTSNTNIIKSLPCKQLISLCICRLTVFHFFRDMPCPMSLVEMKSLIRMEEIIAAAPQPITVLEVSAHSGQGLKEVLDWLESITIKWTMWSVLQVPYEAFKPRWVPSASLVCKHGWGCLQWCSHHMWWEISKKYCCAFGTRLKLDKGIMTSMTGCFKLVESALQLVTIYCATVMVKCRDSWRCYHGVSIYNLWSNIT